MVDMFHACFGQIVDLDELYDKHVKSSGKKIDHLTCVKALGYASYYMQYAHLDIPWNDQAKRVDTLCQKCNKLFHMSCANRSQKDWDIIWFKFHYKILDEIENMC